MAVVKPTATTTNVETGSQVLRKSRSEVSKAVQQHRCDKQRQCQLRLECPRRTRRHQCQQRAADRKEAQKEDLDLAGEPR